MPRNYRLVIRLDRSFLEWCDIIVTEFGPASPTAPLPILAIRTDYLHDQPKSLHISNICRFWNKRRFSDPKVCLSWRCAFYFGATLPAFPIFSEFGVKTIFPPLALNETLARNRKTPSAYNRGSIKTCIVTFHQQWLLWHIVGGNIQDRRPCWQLDHRSLLSTAGAGEYRETGRNENIYFFLGIETTGQLERKRTEWPTTLTATSTTKIAKGRKPSSAHW